VMYRRRVLWIVIAAAVGAVVRVFVYGAFR
jgi:hypothetical protein